MRSPIRTPGLFLAILLAACSGPPREPVPLTRVVETGPLASEDSTAAAEVPRGQVPIDPRDIGWVTALRAEALDAATGVKLDPTVPWRADLRLVNGTRLLAVTSRTPEIRFPVGFAFPLGQVLRDIPEAWRGAFIVAEARDREGRRVKVRATLEYLASAADTRSAKIKRLYVLSLPVAADASQEAIGSRVVRRRYSYIVPVDSTVHFAVAHFPDHARSIRLTDLEDGKILWQAEVASPPGAPEPASIPPYHSETGFPLYREHEYEIEVAERDVAQDSKRSAAVLFLYYRPPGDEEFSYPYPPEESQGAP